MVAKTVELSWSNIDYRAGLVARLISRHFHEPGVKIYGVPRGGVYAALAIQKALLDFKNQYVSYLVEDVMEADVIIDDVVDSGKTMASYESHRKPFYTLVEKGSGHDVPKDVWVSFPWERMSNEQGIEDNIVRILQHIGEDPQREGLKETPARVVKSYGELFAGYKIDPAEVIKTFEDTCDEMVVCRDIEFTSVCEHHMLPFIGKAHIAYIPDGRIIGLSKLARVLDIFAKRLQVQERLTIQVTTALDEYLKPKGSACVIEAKHLCMMCRGVQKQSSSMVTSSLTGVFRDHAVRQEFFQLIK